MASREDGERAPGAAPEREIYLEDVPLETARERFERALVACGVVTADGRPMRLPAEEVGLEEALDRVSAFPVFARLSSPHYHACAMDGIAVNARSTRGASETSPRTLRLGEEAVWVDTGDPLPPGMDAVIMAEEIEQRSDVEVAIRAAVPPFNHVRPIGEDVVATEAVVAAGRTLGPADLAAIASAGVTRVRVVRRPRVAIITTGSELVAPDVERPPRGAILDSNGILLAACVRRYGGEPVRFAAIPDDRARLEAAVDEAVERCDVVVVNAGSSAGSEDYTARIFAARGDVPVHGVAIRPGHPVVLAATRARGDGRGVPLLGIPGYPVSAALCAEIFLRPLVERLGLREPPDVPSLEVVLTRKLFSPLGEDEYVRAVAARVGDRLVASPLRRGAGVITSLSRANCLIVVPRSSEGARAGERVTARALRSRAAIERTLLAVGSHDVAIDLLAGRLAERRGLELVSANVGSIAGLVALAGDSTHVAGTHVLDVETGSYNALAVERYVPGRRVALLHFATREQGLIVAKGNPLGLRSLTDVAATRARYVNRQKDAGTRLLLDALLAREGVPRSAIEGYDRIEFTHLAVAALVADGSADCGLGVLAAARALDCDFVPLAREPYEFAMLARTLETDDRVRALVETVRGDAALHDEVERLGGYDCSRAGEIRFVEPVRAQSGSPDPATAHAPVGAHESFGAHEPTQRSVTPA